MNPGTTTIGTAATPQAVPSTRGIGSWIRRIVLGLLVALVALPATGAIYQVAATAMDRRTYPAPGQLVDVGGYRLHLHCVGTGSPTVVLEAATAATSAHWTWVQPDAARSTRVCAYDRAGMGWSDAGPAPRDAHHIATELHTMLNHAGIVAPYVFVGHSFGGLFARAYVADYPGEVVGMVLVDATHPDLWTRLPAELATPPEKQPLGLFPIIARLGLTRLGLIDPFPVDPNLAPQQRAEITAFTASTTSMETIAAELRAFPVTASQVRAASDLGDMPLAVLTSEDAFAYVSGELDAQANRVWKDLQQELAALSSNTVHQEIAGTTHESLVNKQPDAQALIGAIGQVVEAVRSGQPLAR